MNIRALAEKDLALTLENNGAGQKFYLIDLDGTSHEVFGNVGYIGFSYDTSSIVSKSGSYSNFVFL